MSKFVMPDGRTYEFSVPEVTNKEAKLLEQVTGERYPDLSMDLVTGGPTGKTAFLWLAMRKHDHHVDYHELEFPMGEVKFHLEEVDPTQASPETPTEKSGSPTSTKSTSGPRSPRK